MKDELGTRLKDASSVCSLSDLKTASQEIIPKTSFINDVEDRSSDHV